MPVVARALADFIAEILYTLLLAHWLSLCVARAIAIGRILKWLSRGQSREGAHKHTRIAWPKPRRRLSYEAALGLHPFIALFFVYLLVFARRRQAWLEYSFRGLQPVWLSAWVRSLLFAGRTAL